MNHHLNPSKTALALGAFVAVMHVIWSVLIALGWAQAIIDFKLGAHMISASVTVQPFNLMTSVTMIIVYAAVGWVVGHIFARVWNWANRA